MYKILINYLNICNSNTPIFIKSIEKYVKISDYNKLYVCLNRLVRKEKLKTFSKGVYYKGTITKEQVIEKKYIKDDNGIKGYLVGDSLLYELGLIKDEPEIVDLISNVCYKGSRYKNNTLGVIVHRPRIDVNSENYRYLQLFDLIKLNVDKNVVFKFIKDNNLGWEKIIEYASLSRNKRVLDKLYN